jgi:hypothetical protein
MGDAALMFFLGFLLGVWVCVVMVTLPWRAWRTKSR